MLGEKGKKKKLGKKGGFVGPEKKSCLKRQGILNSKDQQASEKRKGHEGKEGGNDSWVLSFYNRL